jgi:hypothetical protein
MTEYNAYSMKLAGFLMLEGFVLKHMRRDEKSNRNIFIFNNSSELQRAVARYLEQRK